MKSKLDSKKSFIGFFQQINKLSKKQTQKPLLSRPSSDTRIMEQLNFDNVAYLSDN